MAVEISSSRISGSTTRSWALC